MTWSPLLEGDDAARARVAIAAIVERVVASPPAEPGFMGGWAGVALLHGYLARHDRATGGTGEEAAARAHDALARALAMLSDDAGGADRGPWFASGLAGVAWVLAHLRDQVDADDDMLAQLDELIAEVLARDAWPLPYEHLYGLVGLGVYALERGRTGDVARVVAHLDARATRDAGGARGATWWSDGVPGADDARGHHDLGLAHGVAGAIALLAAACDAGADAARARPLLADAVIWLLDRERADRAPRFPSWSGITAQPRPQRNGWCYGDLAIACAVARAGQVAHEPAWIARAAALARAHVRGPIDDVDDVGVTFCHGTAGRAHLLHRLGRALGDAELLAAARRYVVATIDRLAASPIATPALSNGWAGVALALVAAIAPVEPAWDRAFLIALPAADH